MNPQDNPLFTAYALGELSAEEARELHALMAATPSAAHELEQIEAVTDALRHGAPIPQSRLTHEQRHSVLHPSNLPRRVQPMMPRQQKPRKSPVFWTVMGGMMKAAAVIALTGAAFLAGWSFSPMVKDAAEIATTEPKAKEAPEAAQKAAFQADDITKAAPEVLVADQAIKARAVPAKLTPMPEIKPELAKKEAVEVVKVVATAKPAALPAPVAPAPKIDLGFTMPEGRRVFASTTKQASDEFSLHPGLIKPAPPKAKGEVFASPQPMNVKNDVKAARVSEVYIHSWKAEVASCPWNPAHRLLRLVIQVPADQPAVFAPDAAFPLRVSFDPANVKQFRMLSERHVAATELRNAGTHVLWYEFQPNGSASDAARDRQVASVTLANARFTSQAVGPFDSSRLQVMDRGYSLQNARDDFVFESAVVGFGLLMRGAEQVGDLNLDLVLNLAKRIKGADNQGERARFIRLVQDAQHVVGL